MNKEYKQYNPKLKNIIKSRLGTGLQIIAFIYFLWFCPLVDIIWVVWTIIKNMSRK